MRNIAILGSTGSIGVNALKVIQGNPEEYKVIALAAGKNVELLMKQIEEMKRDFESYLKRQNMAKLPNAKIFPETMDSLAVSEFCNTYADTMVKQAKDDFLKMIEETKKFFKKDIYFQIF